MIPEILAIILIPNMLLMLFYKSVPDYYGEFLQKRMDRYNKEIDVSRLN